MSWMASKWLWGLVWAAECEAGNPLGLSDPLRSFYWWGELGLAA